MKTKDIFNYKFDFSEMKGKKNFPFLVDLSVATWQFVSHTLMSILKLSSSTLNSLIRFEISHPNSEEVRRRKENFPFNVDMNDMWNGVMKNLKNFKILPKFSKKKC